MENIAGLVSGFITSMDEYSDPRTKGYPLLHGLTPLLIILSLYLYACLYAVPKFMKHREPFRLKGPIITFNLLNVVTCVWLVNELLENGWLRDYSFLCQPVGQSDSPSALRMARATWVFFALKLFDLLDTVFFTLRKKDNQVSYLHLYHHVSIAILAWFNSKFSPGGHRTLEMMINTAVHVIMYSYYLLAALGPQYQKYLWWKKYLTFIQMFQFVILLLHLSLVFFIDCGYPKAMAFAFSLNVAYNLYLFGLFYKQNYTPKTTNTKLS